MNPYRDPVPTVNFNRFKIVLSNSIQNPKPIIPLKIYQTWHTIDMPEKMKQTVNKLKHDNPEFRHYLYDDAMCRTFIMNNFDNDVLNAFDTLKPGAFKADLWRYCILYVNGGIYLDIKYTCKPGFILIHLINKEFFVRDYKVVDAYGVYQALMINSPKNEVLMKSIRQIAANVYNNFYGSSCLEITGPQLINKFLKQEDIIKSELYLDKLGIYYNKQLILTIYADYRKEQLKNQNTAYYYNLWLKKDIYSRERDLNSRPMDLQSTVLPTELSRDKNIENIEII